ncbi:MAG: hypothetical protein KatS3mg117_1996 [Geminicoccaceae bacterium]|jgi:predicted DsbA family dithiol-disulfide isomerase|nr:MAG: hypothetical protein KatS3mg117_1996 [Geminicoccaceae bacterium]
MTVEQVFAAQHSPNDPQDFSPGDDPGHVASQQKLVVTLVADLVCPWCRIAFHTLLPLAERMGFTILWDPFLLNPGMPPQGVARRLYLERKFGSLEAAAAALRRVVRRAAAERLAFAFDRIARQPDTVPAQALLLEAQDAGRLVPFATAAFRAFFEEGGDLGDPELLAALAEEAGLGPEARAAAASADRRARVRAAHKRALGRDIDGVPALLVPGVGVLAGAQPAEVFEGFLEIGLLAAAGARPAQGRQGS